MVSMSLALQQRGIFRWLNNSGARFCKLVEGTQRTQQREQLSDSVSKFRRLTALIVFFLLFLFNTKRDQFCWTEKWNQPILMAADHLIQDLQQFFRSHHPAVAKEEPWGPHNSYGIKAEVQKPQYCGDRK